MSATINGAELTIELMLGASYVDAVRSGLVGYWRLGETSGTTAAAVVGNPAAYYGGPTLGRPGLLAGDTNTAVRVSGAAAPQFISLPSSAMIGSPQSAFWWFERLGLPDGAGPKDWHTMLQGLSGDGAFPRLLLGDVGTILYWQGYDAGSVLRQGSTAVAAATGPHLFGWTHDGTTVQMYFDGLPVGAPIACTGLQSPAPAMDPRVGVYANPSELQANGIFDEVRLYNRALSAAEAAELYRVGTEGAWTDLTCRTTSAEWAWGAPEALGPLTECEGGTLRVSMIDPDRDFDPDNPDSPLLGVLKVGLPFRVIVDGSPAWTGALQTWAWDRASMIADLNGLDPIGMLSVRILPERFTMAPVSTTSAAQAQFVLDFVEWPTGKRYFPDGLSGVERGNHYVEGSALDALQRIRFAELGRLFPLRDGGIGWYDRDGPAPPAPSAVINCGGVGLTDMWRVMGLGRLRNRVVVSGGYGVFGQPRPPDEYRSVTTSSEFLAFAYTAPAALPWDIWAQTILDALDPPPVLTMLGTILPQGPEVAEIVTAEFGDRWTVANTGEPDKVVQVLGQRVTLAPGTIEVDAVTEDIFTPVPFAHRTVGTGSGYLMSQDGISYANARAGSGVTVTIGSGAGPQYYVGQAFGGGPIWQVWESFLWFDTSAIPVGATIVSAEFAGMFHPHWNGITPPPAEWTHFDVELRAGYAWRPTLAAADWRAGASIAATYPLRAKINTARALKDSFATFEDAGSGLAGAIVKGGETQVFLVSSRTVAGTAPASTTVFEDLYIDAPRLRVTYTL